MITSRDEKGPTSEAIKKTGEGEKGEEDEESPKTGGMLLFGTLFKYMDKDLHNPWHSTIHHLIFFFFLKSKLNFATVKLMSRKFRFEKKSMPEARIMRTVQSNEL